jgi:hypothetical protein
MKLARFGEAKTVELGDNKKYQPNHPRKQFFHQFPYVSIMNFISTGNLMP